MFSYHPTDDPRWLIQVSGFEPQLERAIEAVCAVVNGYLGVRAALEEGSEASRPATLIAGVFNTPEAPQAPELNDPIPEIVVAPDWCRLRISVAGQELRIGQVELLQQRRTLDMRQGALLREWRVRDGQGRVTALRSLRFASLADRRTLVQVISLTPENYSAEVTVELRVEGRVRNENAVRHLAVDAPEPLPLPGQAAVLTARTLRSGYRLACAASVTTGGAASDQAALSLTLEREAIVHRLAIDARQGQGYTIEKIVAVATSREAPEPAEAAGAVLAAAQAQGVAELLRAHESAWADRWSSADVTVGDDAIQREVRYALYHLIGAANPDDERASIGARALTGERYRGHVFWDTETFAWPFYLFTEPRAARALLLYRYHTLDGARAKARALGYRGALYSWESTDTGEETTPPFIRNPAGEQIAVLTGVEEHHIAADVAYAVAQYVQATGDVAFFRDYGAEMLLEVARFWASRAEPGDDGRYHIRKVIGPDEYHESVDDNAYTNAMAAWSLRRGVATAEALRRDEPERWAELSARLRLDDDELRGWRGVADRLVTGFDPETGLFEQFTGYHRLRMIDLGAHDTAAATLDVKLGWRALQETQAIKQADVVMLLFLQWEELTPAVREANFRFYEPRTAHDSSLSPSMHALVAARLGDMRLAERYLRQAALIDLDFSRRGWAGASGGVHIAALGGIWQALVFGFLGMRPHDDGLRFDPQVPESWGELRAPVRWRGRQLRVAATAGGAELTLESGSPLPVALRDGPWQELVPGHPLSVALER